jgi:hypothetical protein
MSVPELDPEQRRQALEKAAEARRVRAELKQMLKAGELTISELLDRAEDSDHVQKMRVSEVVSSMPGYGKVKARRLMEELDIAQSRRVRGLGPNQRERLLAEFGEPSGS